MSELISRQWATASDEMPDMVAVEAKRLALEGPPRTFDNPHYRAVLELLNGCDVKPSLILLPPPILDEDEPEYVI